MAEWLGSALQKLLQRFESASDLQPQKAPGDCSGFFCALSSNARDFVSFMFC